MRFRSDCKYSKAALNLESTHELLASILALKNKAGLQADALILGNITESAEKSVTVRNPF